MQSERTPPIKPYTGKAFDRRLSHIPDPVEVRVEPRCTPPVHNRCHRRTGNNCGRHLLLLPLRRALPLGADVADAPDAVGAYWEGNLAEMSAADGLAPVHPEVNDDRGQVMAIPSAVAAAAVGCCSDAEDAAGAGDEGCLPPAIGRGHYKLIVIPWHPDAVAVATVEGSHPPMGNAVAAGDGGSAKPKDAAAVAWGTEVAAGVAGSTAPGSAGRTRRVMVFGMGTTLVQAGGAVAAAGCCKENRINM